MQFALRFRRFVPPQQPGNHTAVPARILAASAAPTKTLFYRCIALLLLPLYRIQRKMVFHFLPAKIKKRKMRITPFWWCSPFCVFQFINTLSHFAPSLQGAFYALLAGLIVWPKLPGPEKHFTRKRAALIMNQLLRAPFIYFYRVWPSLVWLLARYHPHSFYRRPITLRLLPIPGTHPASRF